MASISGSWREILAGAGLLLAGILLQEAFVEIAQPLLAGVIPIQLVQLLDQQRQRRGLLDEGAGVAEDLLHQHGPVSAQVDQHDLVEFQSGGRRFALQIVPAVALRAAGPPCRSPWPS